MGIPPLPHPTSPLLPSPALCPVLAIASAAILLACSLEFYLSAAHVSTGVSMGGEAETLILCRVAMDRPVESYDLIAVCLHELYNLRPGMFRQEVGFLFFLVSGFDGLMCSTLH